MSTKMKLTAKISVDGKHADDAKMQLIREMVSRLDRDHLDSTVTLEGVGTIRWSLKEEERT